MSKPTIDFMIIGAQKSGTTALAQFLAQHPQICMATPKETHVFDGPLLEGDWTVGEANELYEQFFDEPKEGRLRGEATPIYLYWEHIVPRLRKYNPGLKVIVLLRDPVDRAISHYVMEKARGAERLPLPLALLAEPWRLWRGRRDFSLRSPWRVQSYMDRGRYRRQLRNLHQHFPAEQVLCLSAEHLWQEHDSTLEKVFGFLSVDTTTRIPQKKIASDGQKIFSEEDEPASASWVRRLLSVLFFNERRWLTQRVDGPSAAEGIAR